MNKLILTYIVLLFCMVLSLPLAAQDYYIKGFLLYPNNSKPVINAEVYIHGTNIKTVTDTFGGFKLRVNAQGAYILDLALSDGMGSAEGGEVTVEWSNEYAIIFFRPHWVACGILLPQVFFKNVDMGSGKIIDKEWIENTGIR